MPAAKIQIHPTPPGPGRHYQVKTAFAWGELSVMERKLFASIYAVVNAQVGIHTLARHQLA
jgi:hypothetical protein